jgi:hypothetical protein
MLSKSSSYYLTVDLDFWGLGSRNHREFPWKFLKKLMSLDVPLKAYDEHHFVISDINKYDYDVLINIDYHSDISNINVEDFAAEKSFLADNFNCGTWANYVKNRNNYLWIYPERECISGKSNIDSRGYCNDDPNLNPFLLSKKDVRKCCAWKDVAHRKKFITTDELSRVVAISIVLSYDFAAHDHIDSFKLFAKQNKIKIDKYTDSKSDKLFKKIYNEYIKN